MGRFFFTPGALTPSLFNDDAMLEVLKKAGVDECDRVDYSIAGCQEPLIMGGLESGIDMRNAIKQGTKYNGSGCLIGENYSKSITKGDYFFLPYSLSGKFKLMGEKLEVIECF